VQDSQTPPPILLPWAAFAGAGYTNAIPVPSQIGITAGAASYTDGFPPLTFVPFAAGGAGPFGRDFNGAMNQWTAGLQWLQAGAPNFYNATFSAAIGGYPRSTVLSAAAPGATGQFWISTVDNNTSDPDTGGANWLPFRIPPAAYIYVSATPGIVAFTVPTGVYTIQAACCGGGGGGAGTNAVTGFTGGGGGAGGYVSGFFATTPGTVISMTVGAGGAAGIASGLIASNGANGGSSSIGVFFSASGGTGGASFANAAGGVGGLGVVSIGQGVPLYGGDGGDGMTYASNLGAGNGGASFFGGGTKGATAGVSRTPAVGAGGGGGYGGGGGSPGTAGVIILLGY
jgi:glycine rich protein